jgi:cysteine protease ATG4
MDIEGEWYGPGTACYVMRDLVALHQQRQTNIFRVHVSSEGTLYKETIYELMTKDGAKKREQQQFEQQQQQQQEEGVQPSHPLDQVVPELDELELDLKDLEWDTSLLLLIPLRLGLDVFNEEYVQSVAHIFSLPQSVGILGGRPRGARWFYGAYADGSKILGLDPHTVQSAPKVKEEVQGTTNDNKKELCIDLTDEYLASVHTAYPELLDLNRMDPSIALGFYCRNRKDFIDLEDALTRTNPNSSVPKLVSFLDKLPNYMSSVSANDMMLHDLDDDGVFDDPQDEISDEDDYVLL